MEKLMSGIKFGKMKRCTEFAPFMPTYRNWLSSEIATTFGSLPDWQLVIA